MRVIPLMRKRNNHSGKKINKLTVLDIAEDRYVAGKDILWNCLCDCGKICQIRSSVLKRGKIQSCGCLKQKTRDNSPRWTGFEEISGSQFNKIKYSAKSRGIPFNVNIEYIWELFKKQNRKCAISGLEISFLPSEGMLKTASLDRIDSEKGYIKGNLQWLHQDINFMKNDFNSQKFIDLCKVILKY